MDPQRAIVEELHAANLIKRVKALEDAAKKDEPKKDGPKPPAETHDDHHKPKAPDPRLPGHLSRPADPPAPKPAVNDPTFHELKPQVPAPKEEAKSKRPGEALHDGSHWLADKK